jgi:uncharacterized protein
MPVPLAALLLLWTSAAAAQPAFDCARAEGPAQKAVCTDPALAALDRELSRLYGLAVDGPRMTSDRQRELRAMQRGWIKGRDDCWKADDLTACVRLAYAVRIHDLRQGYADAHRDDEAGISSGPVPLLCDGVEGVVSAAFIRGDAPVVSLNWPAGALALPLTRSASGARYSDGAATFWSKGEAARLTLDGTDHACRLDSQG